MRSALILVPLLVSPSWLAAPAAANPLEIGASLGVNEDMSYQASSHALGVFGRIGLAPAISGQLELAKLDNDQMGTAVRTGNALIVVDLGHGSLAPIALAGVGMDTTSDINADRRYAHAELGAGLEYRALGGVTLGADVRIGTRKLVDDRETGLLTAYEPLTLSAGDYRSARITLGVTF